MIKKRNKEKERVREVTNGRMKNWNTYEGRKEGSKNVTKEPPNKRTNERTNERIVTYCEGNNCI